MTRALAFALLSAGVVSASAARAELPVAPPPREVRPDGTRDPVPAREVVKKEDPREIVERIIKNSKDVGDKLAMTDIGTDTRNKQDTVLKDIDRLLNQDPPPDKDKNPDKNQDKNDSNQNKNDMKPDMMPDPGMGNPPPKTGMQPPPMGNMGGMEQQPMGGGGSQLPERRPRQNGDQKQQAQPKEPGKGRSDKKQEPMGGMTPKEPPKNPGGGKLPDPKGGMPPPNQPLFPNEEVVVKDVWGHLPDKLRQQATQYYRQEFMPRYSELLKMYYSSLSEKQK